MPNLQDAYRLFHEGAIALAQIEKNGIKVDVGYLEQATKDISVNIKTLNESLRQTPIYRTWRRQYGEKTNMGSREQLAHIIFTIMKYPCGETTKTGRPKADESAFDGIDLPFLKDYFRLEKLKKAKSTYLEGLQREVIDGYVHPFINLNTVETYRSSSDSPNLQNQPARNTEIGEIIRRCFVARKGRRLVEVDFSALEFVIASCFWRDPKMVEYASDPTKDIHRDMAALCYCCDKEDVSKTMRYCAKNQFVFPILYGSYYLKCAQNLWEMIDANDLEVGAIPVKRWLEDKGITSLGDCNPKEKPIKGTFEYHIKTIEDKFNKKFSVWSKAKEEWFAQYRKKGGFSVPTGFWIGGLRTRNFLSNAPIQSSAFHCLLWSMTKIQKELIKKKMKSLVIMEVHDSILADVPNSEIQDYLNLTKRIMTVDVRKHWDWIIAPLKVEVDVTPIGGNWFEKSPWIEVGGVWKAK